ncbi:MAG: alpha-ketoglutarate-dependent dioxygenase AlkB [Candidatus Aenigmarchaeota archaeon]|nr:alpha-ketoglutarate-dependent dioxygenase AlkB [Candidatus Aenigmarchaeota archaeon]
MNEIHALLDAARSICLEAPLLRPRMTIGGKVIDFKLTLTNAGPLGWWSDERGFRYVDRHPVTEMPFPPIPEIILDIGKRALARCELPPMRIENCLINHYAEGESLGQHQDRTEEDLDAPILSLSVGADALFLLGGMDRKNPTRKYLLRSGDLVIQSGPSRRAFHGIKQIYPTIGNPLRDRGRLNFTLRKVTKETL